MEGPSSKFRLERIRALRERREDEAKQQLASAMTKRIRSRQQLELAGNRIDSARIAQQHASAEDLLAHQFYLERVEQLHRERLADLQCQDEAVQLRRRELVLASQALQTLERLKEKTLDERRREADRAEQRMLDEVAVGMHHRRVMA